MYKANLMQLYIIFNTYQNNEYIYYKLKIRPKKYIYKKKSEIYKTIHQYSHENQSYIINFLHQLIE